MKTKQRLYPSISHGAKAFCFALLMLVTACGGQEDPIVEKEDQLQLSDKEILISADGWKPMTESRATIFDTPLQDSCLENPMDGGTWKVAVHGVAEGQTRLSDFTFTFHFHALEKEMATYSSVLPRDRGAWWAAFYGVAQSRT